MPVNINKVYQKVLALANKEQRGYITPQEFNLFADHAQMEIFEQYFYDIEQRQRGLGNELEYADIQENIEEKISYFEVYDEVSSLGSNGNVILPTNLYKIGMVRVDYDSEPRLAFAERIKLNELNAFESPLTRRNKKRPVYNMISSANHGGKIQVFPNPITPDRVLISYILNPNKPNWAYVISGENALFNPNGSINFELHSSEENKLVIKILALAGVAIKDVQLAQVAAGKDASITQQQKQ